MASNDKYIPGVCNIGPAEIRMRRNTGIAGLLLMIVLFIIFYFFSVHPIIRALAIGLPAVMAASGFLQAQLHFCARFGMSGLFNFGDDIRRQESVDQLEFRRKDQRKAITIIAASTAIGLLIGLVAYFLPFSG
jgi:hypothetical protein